MPQQMNYNTCTKIKCYECAICMQETELIKFSVECEHRFCTECSSQMDKCPLCRKNKKQISSYFGNHSHLSRLTRLIGI